MPSSSPLAGTRTPARMAIPDGTWRIEWFTGNNMANPDFSNLALFARDVAAVPEPGEYAMLLAGLGLLGCLGRRKAR